MTLTVAPLPLAIANSRLAAGSRLADRLRRSYALALVTLALSGWSPVLWNHFHETNARAASDASRTMNHDHTLRHVNRASFEADAAMPEVRHANYIN